MNNDYLNRPLYPQSEYSQNENSRDNQTHSQQRSNSSLLGNLSSLLGGQSGNSLLSLLLGMKGNNGNLSSILSKVGEGNPLFQALSSFQSSDKKSNKKESDCSPKTISPDEILF